MTTQRLAAATLLFLSVSATAADEWEVISTEPIVVKVRPRPNSGGVKEFWAEGDIKGEVIDIQEVLKDTARFTKYMPYMTEARELTPRDPDGAIYIYMRLDMPVLSPRDFIHKTYITKDVSKTGAYASQWHAMPYKIPLKDGVVRLQISEGSWLVTPLPNGKAHMIYKFSADPGGSIPSIFANTNNVKGPIETFASVEREAALKAVARKAKPPPKPAAAVDAGAPSDAGTP